MVTERYNAALEKYQNVDDKGLKWDLIKMELRSSMICFSKSKAKETRETIKQTVLQVEKREKELNKNPTEEILEKYNEGKKQIENYNNVKASSAQLRSKSDWVEQGERNTKFFLNLEKRNYRMKCITKLTTEEDKEISEPETILKY
jgi:hypothetical protein